MSTEIEEITSFKVNGKVFETLQQAKKERARVRIRALLEAACVGRGGSWDADMFEEFLLENRTVLAHNLQELAEEE